jgi:hypothetical protein
MSMRATAAPAAPRSGVVISAVDAKSAIDIANHTLYYRATRSAGTAIAIAQIEAGVTLHPHDIHVAA